MAVIRERQHGTVLTPGLDEEHREVAWLLMARHGYTSAWRLGYAAAALLALVALAEIVFGLAYLGVCLGRREFGMPPEGDARYMAAAAPLAVVVISWLVTAVVHSIFLGLTDSNVPALGGGSPRFDPIRAGLWWIEATLWWMRAALAFVVPVFLCLLALILGGLIFGMVLAIVWVVVSVMLFGDPIKCLGKPGRLLGDLYLRLAVEGSSDTRIVTYWSLAWGIARGLSYAVVVLFGVMVVATIPARIVGGLESAPADQSEVAFFLLDLFTVTIELVAEVIAMGLLCQITLELSRRQRIREQWVLSGSHAAAATAAPSVAAPALVAPVPGSPARLMPGPQPYSAPAPAPAADGPTPASPPAAPPPADPVIRPSTTVPRYGVPGDWAGPNRQAPPRPPGPPESDQR
jgi:hypothetical protein